MQQSTPHARCHIVLVGGGHSHVVVLKRFALRPQPDVRLTIICRDTHTPYSGMLPGYIAGHYQYDDVHINLPQLASYAGAQFIGDEVNGIDRSEQKVFCRSGAPVPYDILSIDIGSAPRIGQVPGARDYAVPVKPIDHFNGRWQALLSRVKHHKGALRLAVVGGGAGGVELLLAMQYRLSNELHSLGRDAQELKCLLFTRGEEILPTHNAKVRAHFRRVLLQRDVTLHAGAEVIAVESGRLQTASGYWYKTDETIWVTNAGGSAWLRETGLELDAKGFIKVGDTLQSLSDPKIFAVGDVASQINHPRAKAGVIAVRQGRPLANNLRAVAVGSAAKPFYPQKRWLALISTGDRCAIASRGALYFSGTWVWRWKDWIDRRFICSFNHVPPGSERRDGTSHLHRLRQRLNRTRR